MFSRGSQNKSDPGSEQHGKPEPREPELKEALAVLSGAIAAMPRMFRAEISQALQALTLAPNSQELHDELELLLNPAEQEKRNSHLLFTPADSSNGATLTSEVVHPSPEYLGAPIAEEHRAELDALGKAAEELHDNKQKHGRRVSGH